MLSWLVSSKPSTFNSQSTFRRFSFYSLSLLFLFLYIAVYPNIRTLRCILVINFCFNSIPNLAAVPFLRLITIYIMVNNNENFLMLFYHHPFHETIHQSTCFLPAKQPLYIHRSNLLIHTRSCRNETMTQWTLQSR